MPLSKTQNPYKAVITEIKTYAYIFYFFLLSFCPQILYFDSYKYLSKRMGKVSFVLFLQSAHAVREFASIESKYHSLL